MEDDDSPPPSPPPLKRGRPRKQEPLPESPGESPPPVKKRGRPRKVADIEDPPPKYSPKSQLRSSANESFPRIPSQKMCRFKVRGGMFNSRL